MKNFKKHLTKNTDFFNVLTDIALTLAAIFIILLAITKAYCFIRFHKSTVPVATELLVVDKRLEEGYRTETYYVTVTDGTTEFDTRTSWTKYNKISIDDVLTANVYYYIDTYKPCNNQKLRLIK